MQGSFLEEPAHGLELHVNETEARALSLVLIQPKARTLYGNSHR